MKIEQCAEVLSCLETIRLTDPQLIPLRSNDLKTIQAFASSVLGENQNDISRNPSLKSWYSKAYSEFQNGNSSVILTFARTDTKAFHEFAINATEICFLKGRLRFIDPKTGQPGNTAPSPSMLVIFDASQPDLSDFSTMDARLNLRGA